MKRDIENMGAIIPVEPGSESAELIMGFQEQNLMTITS
jgi:hypothetical protein